MENSIRHKRLAGMNFIVFMLLLTLVSGTAWSAERWDMAAAYSPKEYITSSYIAFAKKVTKSTGGALKIVVHPSGSLVKGADIFGAVESGKVQIGAFLLGAQAKQGPIFGIDTVPFLATSVDKAWELYQVSKNELGYELKERNMKLLFTAVWPPQGLFTKVKLNSIADMKNMRFRAYDEGTARLAKLMGAIPTITEATENKMERRYENSFGCRRLRCQTTCTRVGEIKRTSNLVHSWVVAELPLLAKAIRKPAC